MRRFAFVLTLLFALPACADDKAKSDKPKSPDEKFTALSKEVEKEMEAFIAAVQKAKPEDRQKLFQNEHPTPKFAEKFLALAKENPKTDAAAQSLCWVVENMGGGPIVAESVKILSADHLKSPKIGPLCPALAGQGSPESEAMLLKIMTENPAKEVQGQACFGLAVMHKQRSESGDAKGAEEAAKMAERYFEQVTAKFGELDSAEGKLADLAKPELFELRNLGIGKTAPDITLKDLDDKEAKLSTLRGKVVVLDIWATWCGPCRAMIPHEREMVKKFEGKPFEFVSISFDDSKETLQKFMKKEPMPWTHWFNGPDGAFGKDWNIKHFPTIYVIDAKGVIRYKEIRGKKLDEAVETLVAEAEKK